VEERKGTNAKGKSHRGNISTAINTIQPVYPELTPFLYDFSKWLNRNLASFITNRHYNREIPGQLSFNDYKLHEYQVLFIIESEKIHLSTLMRMISALALGVKIIVVERNRKIKWEKIPRVEFLYKIENRFIAQSSVRKIIFNAESTSIEKRMNEIYEAASGPELIKIHYSQYDAPPADDYTAYLLEFIKVRSLAINTMKHGVELKR
jgi:hypothetical protein